MSEVVQSVDRALSIIEVLSDYKDGISIKELSEKVDLHKSTVHRLLATLIEKGYVKKDSKTSNYTLTFKIFEIGNKIVENIDLVEVAKPFLKKLVEKTGEVVHLVVRDGTDVVYLDKVEPENTIRMYSRIGRRSQMYYTAVGKVIMAYMTDEEVKNIWNKSLIKKLTPKSITDFDEYMKIINKARKNGFALDDEEHEMGIRCIGSAILDYRGNTCGAISISGPTMRFTEDKILPFSELIKEFSNNISKELGYVER